MASTLLINELTNLISDSKRKNADLRNAAEKSLQELKGLPATSEQQLAAGDLSRRPAFIEPFLIACATKTTRYATSGVNCLQRLVISRGLPKARLQDALEAFNACTDLGLDIQLKVLQALPSLLQNYADDLKGDLLSGALEVCSSLQSAKVQTVSGVAAATLQQLIASIFDKVGQEDRQANAVLPLTEVDSDDGPVHLKPAAFDAYRIFRDLALTADRRKTRFVQFATLSPELSLELIWSCLNANSTLFASHPELTTIIRIILLPVITRSLSDKLSYPITLRSVRILDVVLARYILQFPDECETALNYCLHSLDTENTPPWKRSLVMELLRNLFVRNTFVIDAYSSYDMNGKSFLQDLMSALVRLSAEKPAIIGLGQQSSVPMGPAQSKESETNDPTSDAVGSVAGVVSTALGVAEANVSGISSRWSLPRTPCLDHLDKAEAPPAPETYVYALVLECLSSLSDSLAKIVLPLTVHHEKSKKNIRDTEGITNESTSDGTSTAEQDGSQAPANYAIPLNPLDNEEHSTADRVKVVNAIVDSCWPAVLATSSTFFNAALDDQYYRNLIKAYQRFTQVAGLLRLGTARDALMTTLGKAAVPAHVLNFAFAEGSKSPVVESPRVFSNPKSLLSVDSLVSQASTLSLDKDRRSSAEPQKPMLTTRNLLCLRALLNLAIALGPTLDTAFAVVVDTLRQADLILSSTTPQQIVRQSLSASQKDSESPSVVQAFSNEVAAVEAAASRFLESTADYPNDAFAMLLHTLSSLLQTKQSNIAPSPKTEQASPPPTPRLISRTFSGLAGTGKFAQVQMQNCKFAIPKLGSLAELNISRFVGSDPEESGWNELINSLISLASNNASHKAARRAATSVLCKVASGTITEVSEEDADVKTAIQRRTLAVLLRLIDSIYVDDGELTTSDIECQAQVVEALQVILETSGESLVSGWNRTIAIISSVFERSGSPPDRRDDEATQIDWQYVSNDLIFTQLGRTAFAATQLICSDFLTALPTAVMPSLIELLYRFVGQQGDLNIALSTVTMTWNVSDYLLGAIHDGELSSIAHALKEADDFDEEVQKLAEGSIAAQWTLLLVRLRDVVATGQTEVRKAAFQTVCSIFKSHGTQITPVAWDLTLRSIILRIAFVDVFLYHDSNGVEQKQETHSIVPDRNISMLIITAVSEVIAQHLRVIEQVKQLPSLWETLLSRLEAYLDLDRHKLNATVYEALARVLARIETGSKAWMQLMYRTLHLWLKRNPAIIDTSDKDSNQDALLAYVHTGAQLYRLTQQSMSVSQTRTFAENLYLAIRHSDGPQYGADVSILGPLQANALGLLKAIRTDTPSTLLVVAAKLITLHHDTANTVATNKGPTFIAIASEAMEWIQSLTIEHSEDHELWETGVLLSVVENLRRLIQEKYTFRGEHKGTALWRRATITAIGLSKPLLALCRDGTLDDSTTTSMLAEFVQIASGIVKAKGLAADEGSDRVHEDELTDIESFRALERALIKPLGDSVVPNELRLQYARAIFEASIVHATERHEVPEPGSPPLENIGTIRRGRVKRIPFSQREKMCYECLSELVRLSSKGDPSHESQELAKAALPLLVLRLAIPIRAYIADQPLRGRRPQPLSELEELLLCFETIRNLQCEPGALLNDSSIASQSGENAHLRYLYPLLAKAVAIAGDRWSGADEVLGPLQRVLEAISPVP